MTACAAVEILVADVGRLLGDVAVRPVHVPVASWAACGPRVGWRASARTAGLGRPRGRGRLLVGFFIAAYTGALLTATNQPIWSDSVWIAPLFLTSAASTGIAAMILLVRWRRTASPAALERLGKADLWTTLRTSSRSR